MNVLVHLGYISIEAYFIFSNQSQNIIYYKCWLTSIFTIGIFLYCLKGIVRSYVNNIDYKTYIIFSVFAIIIFILYCPLVSIIIQYNWWMIIDFIGEFFVLVFLIYVIQSK